MTPRWSQFLSPRRLLAAAAGLLLLASSATALAQSEGRFERFIERLDRDGNKVIDPGELDQIQGPFRGMLESNGVDLSRPISTEDLSERLRRRSEPASSDSDRGRDGERRDFGGRGYGGRDFGGRDYGGRDYGSRDYGTRDYGSRDFGGRDSSRDADRRSGSPSASTARSQPYSARPASLVKREKLTVALPSQYAAGDLDHDGQIALSEWKTWKGRAALGEFAQLDRNGDGFLTPRELVARTPSAAKPASVAQSAPAPATVAPAPAAPAASASTGSGTPAPSSPPANSEEPGSEDPDPDDPDPDDPESFDEPS